MDGNKDSRLLEILNSFLEKKPVPGGNTDELDVPVPNDYMAQCIGGIPDVPETAVEGEIRLRTESLLDSFIENAPSLPVPEPASSDGIYSETLAGIFVKQHRYDRALEIIKSLYLNFPNKSVYFADQIRYLEKLVRINQKK